MRQLKLGGSQPDVYASRIHALIVEAFAARLALLERVRQPPAAPPSYPPIAIGARVKYTRAFLKSILEPPTGRLWALESKVISVGPRWLTIVRDGETDSMLVHPANVQRVEIPDAQVNSAAESTYAGIFLEPRWEGDDAEALRSMGDLRSRGL